MSDPASAPADLRMRVVRGLGWSTAAFLYGQVSRLAFGIVLVRLLTPHDYGIAGMALIFSSLVLGISDMGLGAGLVQRTSISDEDRSTVFWTSLGIGLSLMIVGFGLAGLVANFFGEPAVAPLFAAVSVGFLVTALGRTHAALLQRDMDFRAIALRGVAASFAGGCVGITLAALGYGPWALVGLHLTIGVVTTALLWVVVPWRPGFLFSTRSLRSIGSFGLNVFGTRVVDYVNGNLDKILVGRFLGSASLGVYSIAWNFVLIPFIGLSTAVSDTLFPALSRIQHDHERVAIVWSRASRSLAMLIAPAMLGLIVVAPDFVSAVLGEKWEGAVPVLQIIALGTILLATTALSPVVLTSINRTGTLFRFSAGEAIAVVVALLMGLQWGVIGVSAGFVASLGITRSFLLWLTARILGAGLSRFFSGFAGVVQAGLVMAGFVWLLRIGLVHAGFPPAARFFLLVLWGVLVYVAMCFWRCPDAIDELRRLLQKERGQAVNEAPMPMRP